MDRRRFLTSIAVAPFATAAAGCGPTAAPLGDAGGEDASIDEDGGVVAPPAAAPLLGPFVCDPRPDAMGFFLEGAGQAEYSVVVTPVGEGAPRPGVLFALDAHRIGRADVDGLSPATTYIYDVFSAGVLVGGGSFRTPPASRASAVRLAIGADIHWEWKPYLAFERVREAEPEALFMIGDQIYADYRAPGGTAEPTEEAYRALHAIYWDDASLASCWANVPTLSMWDDHEIIQDYDGVDATRFAAAEAAFRAYQGARNPAPYRAGVHYFATTVGPIDVFVLDTRSYRDGNDVADGPGKTMLGAQQREDLEEYLLASDAPVKLVISPTPFHAHVTTGNDGWALGFASERDALFAFIRDEGITGVVLASGDQHWPAVVRHDLGSGVSLVELQCTPTAAHPRGAPAIAGEPDVLYVGPGAPGFGLLEVDATEGTATARFAWVGADGEERFAMNVDVG